MDDVTPEMTAPEYWLKSSHHPDMLLLTETEIAQRFKTPEKDFERVSIEGKVDSGLLNEWMKKYGQRRSLYDINGNDIDSCHWDSAICNMNISNISGKVRYAVTVANTEERVLPTRERGYQDSDNALFDDLVMTKMLVNEPLLVLHISSDSLWYFVLGKYAPSGWVPKEDIAFCDDINSWNETQAGDFLLITADRMRLEMNDPNGKDYTELTMGSKLKLIDPDSVKIDNYHRLGRNVYAVKFPTRDENGNLYYREEFLPARDGVHVGYLPFTRRNILKQAFSCLGDRYGWGGTFGARDCSSFCQDVYRCFGILLPRNSSMQVAYQGKTIDIEGMDSQQKYIHLKKEARPGSLLYMPGHIFMYLGEKDGKIYTINSASSVKINGEKTYIQSVVINSLDEIRGSGKTWLESTTKIKIYEKDY